MRGEDQTMHGVQFRSGFLALPVRGELEHFAANHGLESFSVGREFAANAIWVRQQDRAAHGETFVAKGVVLLFEKVFGSRQIRRIKNVNVSKAGNVGADLEEIHAIA